MAVNSSAKNQLQCENDCLRARLAEAEEALRAIRNAEVDALVVSTKQGKQIYTREGADQTFRVLVENMSEGALNITPAGVILYANSCFAKMLQSPLEKVISTSLLAWVDPADRGILQSLLAGEVNKQHRIGLRLVAGNGAHVPVQLSLLKRQKEDDPVNICVVITDLTEAKKIENELFKADKLEAIGTLAGGIAHDFNNYLATFLGNIALAKVYKNDPEKVLQKLSNMEKAILRAKELSNQLFTFARGGAPLKERVALKKLIMESINFTLSGSQVRPAFFMEADLQPVEADASQLNQVLNNMALNAVQAMPMGGTLEIRAENISLNDKDRNFSLPLPEGPYVKLTLRDEGIGIPEKYLKKLFDPFFTTKNKGRGLGLATCFSVIKKHGGYIGVESKTGVGTCFTIFLPSIDETAGTVPAEDETAEILSPGDHALKGTGKILLMDDEADLLYIMTEFLSSCGYRVISAREGREAIDLYAQARAQNQPFDLVILDLTIPGGLGGKRTMQELYKLDPAVKAIVASGYSNDPVMAGYSDFGFQGVLKKPFTLEDLSNTVREVLG